MTPTIHIAEFIKSFEGCRLKAYLPTPNDVPTIGYGSTGPDIKMGMSWTLAQADDRFSQDLAKFSKGVSDAMGPATTQAQFDACCSLAYNIGLSAFHNSTLLKKHLAHDYTGAAAQFALWNKQAGKVLNGLVKRRTAEARVYRGLPA